MGEAPCVLIVGDALFIMLCWARIRGVRRGNRRSLKWLSCRPARELMRRYALRIRGICRGGFRFAAAE